MYRFSIVALGVSALLSGCATPPPAPTVSVEAQRIADPPKPVEIVEVPKVLALPGQLKSLPPEKWTAPDLPDPKDRVVRANAVARVEPSRANYLNATQVWPYSSDALYQIYASPDKITDIALDSGEELVSVSAGDTVRWVIGDTTSGEGDTRRVHILVKPVREDVHTNLVIASNRRSYHLEMTATPTTWMASVSWTYPMDQLVSLRAVNERAQSKVPVAEGLNLERLNFHYEISGDSPPWRPLRAFDDDEKVYIQFPASVAQGDMPPLFIVGERGATQLVNYRVHSPYYIVDRLFQTAELRLGEKKQLRVRIDRTPERQASADQAR